MTPYLAAHSLFTPLGFGSEANWQALLQGKTGITLQKKFGPGLDDFYASVISGEILEVQTALLPIDKPLFTRLEKMMLAALYDAQERSPFTFSSDKTVFVFSSTKGNIELLNVDHRQDFPANRDKLSSMAAAVSGAFQNPNTPYVVSNACISGVSAMLLGQQLLQSGRAEQVVICGGDLVSAFTTSGFQCLQAISPFPCTPFDINRKGLSPGEGVGVVVLTAKTPMRNNHCRLVAGATSNDANHISGPSRTGDGLAIAIRKALQLSAVSASDIGYLNAHGTGTLYNDESESLAFAQTNLAGVPVNSLKGYFGHTFGAAGVIETIITTMSMQHGILLPSIGYKTQGTSTSLPVLQELTSASIGYSLKTASGFGGCNAALLLSAND